MALARAMVRGLLAWYGYHHNSDDGMKWALIWIAASLADPTVTYFARTKLQCEQVGAAVAARHIKGRKPVWLCARVAVDVEREPVIQWVPPTVGVRIDG